VEAEALVRAFSGRRAVNGVSFTLAEGDCLALFGPNGAGAAEPKELVVIDAADHLFDGRVAEVADAIEDLLGDWQA